MKLLITSLTAITAVISLHAATTSAQTMHMDQAKNPDRSGAIVYGQAYGQGSTKNAAYANAYSKIP